MGCSTTRPAGLRYPSPVCVMTLALVETDFGKPPYEHRAMVEHLNCPYKH
jgi:hypothetical protein